MRIDSVYPLALSYKKTYCRLRQASWRVDSDPRGIAFIGPNRPRQLAQLNNGRYCARRTRRKQLRACFGHHNNFFVEHQLR